MLGIHPVVLVNDKYGGALFVLHCGVAPLGGRFIQWWGHSHIRSTNFEDSCQDAATVDVFVAITVLHRVIATSRVTCFSSEVDSSAICCSYVCTRRQVKHVFSSTWSKHKLYACAISACTACHIYRLLVKFNTYMYTCLPFTGCISGLTITCSC